MPTGKTVIARITDYARSLRQEAAALRGDCDRGATNAVIAERLEGIAADLRRIAEERR